MEVIKKTALGLIGLLLNSNVSLGATDKLSPENKMNIARTRCAPREDTEPVLYREDVKINTKHSLEEMSNLYTQIYNSDRRLPKRAGLDPKTQTYISTDGESHVVYPEHFIKTVTLNIENALRLKYADFIFLPDMGHSHFLIPLEYYYNRLEHTPSTIHNSLNKLLSDNPKGLKSLYHTAELLKMHTDHKLETLLKDRYTQWRFYTRNPVIDSRGNIETISNVEDSLGNTAIKYEGYRFTSGFNISANKNGCFPFEDSTGEIQYYDISSWDLSRDCSRTNCNDK